jgi:hypothetical protein
VDHHGWIHPGGSDPIGVSFRAISLLAVQPATLIQAGIRFAASPSRRLICRLAAAAAAAAAGDVRVIVELLEDVRRAFRA